MSARGALVATLRKFYHALVPLGVRRRLRVSRFTDSRRARAALWNRTGGRVAAGPFRGLLLDAAAPDDCEGCVLIGAFECETHDWLEAEIARGWPVVVNVGSNMGFYSSGLALRLPGATVHAFDVEAEMQHETRRSAERNGVADQVRIHGGADRTSLSGLGIDSALVICDCEGCERELINPEIIPWLSRSAVLVELHDFAAPGATDAIRARFEPSHEVRVVEQGPRDAVTWAARATVSVAEARILVEERRTFHDREIGGRWMLLSPRVGNPARAADIGNQTR